MTPPSPFVEQAGSSRWGGSGGRPVYCCEASGCLFYERDSTAPSPDYADYYPYLADWDAARFEAELLWRRKKFTAQLTALAAHGLPPGARILDFGAGPGYFCAIARELGYDAQGVEASPAAREAGARHFGVPYVALDALAPASFDLITAHHVLEHLPAPRAALFELRRLLRPGGLLAIHVPHVEPFTYWLRNRFRPADDRLTDLYGDIHISGFTPASLRAFVTRHGFSALEVRTTGMWSQNYDPFFLANYRGISGKLRAAKKAARHLIEWLGVSSGRGHWVVATFRRDFPME